MDGTLGPKIRTGLDNIAIVSHYRNVVLGRGCRTMSLTNDDANASAGIGKTPQQRREEREPVNLDGPTLRQEGGTTETIKLHDLSSQGFRTDWPYKLVPGDRVWLKLPGLESLPAKVAWELDFMIGCKFDVQLHSAVFGRIVNQAR